MNLKETTSGNAPVTHKPVKNKLVKLK